MHRSFRKDYEEKYNYQSISSHFNDGSDSCAGSKEKSNAMTIGWGGIGTLWGRTALTVYVAEKRYTKEFMDEAEYFTVMSFDVKRLHHHASAMPTFTTSLVHSRGKDCIQRPRLGAGI